MEANVNHRVQMLIDYLLSIKKIKSINDFDKQIGVSRNNTRNIISGRSKEPSFDFTRRTLSTFDFINPDWFLHNEGTMIRANEKVENLDEVIEENKNLQQTVNGLVNMLSLAGQNFKTSNFQPVSNKKTPAKKRGTVTQLPLFVRSVANSARLCIL